VNHRRPWWIAFSLLPLLIALCGLVLPSGCGGGGGGSFPTAVPTPANVAVAFHTEPISPSSNLRSVLINIAGVRINTISNADTAAPGWVTISVPSAAGSGNAQTPGDLQIDLLRSQTGATFFNVGGAPPGTYQTVQVLVDPISPGTIVPACQGGGGGQEGCTNFPVQLDAGLGPVIFTLNNPITVAKNQTAPLLIDFSPVIEAQPGTNGGAYLIGLNPSEVNAGSFLGAVSGNITIKGAGTGIHITPLTVTAELSGTNTIIESVPVGKGLFYTLELPASPSGTAYDLYLSGGSTTYGAVRNLTVMPGQLISPKDITVNGVGAGNVKGLVADACTGLGIPGATLELLAPAPDSPLPTPRPAPPASFCADPANANQCVVVGNASSDQAGLYPLPGTTRHPADFLQVGTSQPDLALRISASGYSPLLSSVFVRSVGGLQCSEASGSGTTGSTTCSFSLTTGFLNGTVNLTTDPPPGNSVIVEVFAETSGTNQLVSALPVPLVFSNQETSLPFKLNLPLTGAGPNYDLFAVAIDPYLGATDPFPGHDIPVLTGVPGPPAACQPGSMVASFPAMSCVGHGSISGIVTNPDLNTTVEVEKNGVQLLGTSPGLFASSSPSNTAYSLCIPPDSYTLQRFEAVPVSSGTASATPIAVGTPQPIAVASPMATSSPCPSTCSNTDTSAAPCPGECNSTAAQPL
jgi:hypothetical protein